MGSPEFSTYDNDFNIGVRIKHRRQVFSCILRVLGAECGNVGDVCNAEINNISTMIVYITNKGRYFTALNEYDNCSNGHI